MIKLKTILSEIRIIKPLRLNKAGKELLAEYNLLETLLTKFEIRDRGGFEGGDLYIDAINLEIFADPEYGWCNKNGITNKSQMEDFMDKEWSLEPEEISNNMNNPEFTFNKYFS